MSGRGVEVPGFVDLLRKSTSAITEKKFVKSITPKWEATGVACNERRKRSIDSRISPLRSTWSGGVRSTRTSPAGAQRIVWEYYKSRDPTLASLSPSVLGSLDTDVMARSQWSAPLR